MSAESVILIVDDEPIGRTALQALLSREGYRLETASDGNSALKAAKELSPDLILLDVMMPGMDGFELTRRIRSSSQLAEVPILLITALDDTGSRLAGIEAGADDFVTKPFNRVELRARIRTILRLNRFRSLTQEREKYLRIFEGSPCGLIVVDNQLIVRELNKVARELVSNWLDGQELGALHQLLDPKSVPILTEMLESTKNDPTVHPRIEFISKSAKNKRIWFELAVSSIPSDLEETYQIAIIDRTAERQLEADLLQAQKLESIGQLAGGIAHDFNNLLTVINGFSMLALDHLPVDDPTSDMISQVYKAGERAAALTRQLLAFSRKEIISPADLDLNALIRDVEKLLRRLIGEHIQVATSLPPHLKLIKADAGHIEQILFNLAVNARDAMGIGGTLTIKTQDFVEENNELQSCKSWVRLTVEDIGCGMTPEIQARIFEPFFTTKAAGKGTGLGLATVYGIVKQCEGRINVQSKVGEGTRFVIDFPAIKMAIPKLEETKTKFPNGSGNETILLAEDEDAVRSFAVAALVSAGYKVLAGVDGEDALSKALAFPGKIDLLFTDAVMPKLSGRGLAEKFSVVRPEIKVVYSSGYDDDSVMQHGILAGKAAFLQKPYTATRLLQKIREVLDQGM